MKIEKMFYRELNKKPVSGCISSMVAKVPCLSLEGLSEVKEETIENLENSN